jgi:peroxiredoxin
LIGTARVLNKRCGRVVLILIALTCSIGCHGQPRSAAKKEISNEPAHPAVALERMPHFKLKDTAGREFSLSDFRGKVLLVDFWGTWCAPCKTEMPGYERLYRKYKERGLVVIGIAADDDAAEVSRFGRKLGISYPLLINGMNVQQYGVEGLPTTILVDRNGLVRKKVVGFEYTQVFDEALRGIL